MKHNLRDKHTGRYTEDTRFARMFAVTMVMGMIVIVGMVILNEGLERHLRVECLEWKAQESMPGFFYEDWQVYQCKNVL